MISFSFSSICVTWRDCLIRFVAYNLSQYSVSSGLNSFLLLQFKISPFILHHIKSCHRFLGQHLMDLYMSLMLSICYLLQPLHIFDIEVWFFLFWCWICLLRSWYYALFSALFSPFSLILLSSAKLKTSSDAHGDFLDTLWYILQWQLRGHNWMFFAIGHSVLLPLIQTSLS